MLAQQTSTVLSGVIAGAVAAAVAAAVAGAVAGGAGGGGSGGGGGGGGGVMQLIEQTQVRLDFSTIAIAHNLHVHCTLISMIRYHRREQANFSLLAY